MKDETIRVFVCDSILRRVYATGFDHDVVLFCNEALGDRDDGGGEAGAQSTKQLANDGLFPFVLSRPRGCASDGPAKFVSHAVYERLRVPFCQFRENVMH